MCVGRAEVKISLVHRDAAIPNVLALRGRMVVVPDLVAGACIHGPDVVRNGEVQNAIDQQRRGLDGRELLGLKGPGKAQILDVQGRNLSESTVASAGIVAMVSRPTVGGRVK